MSAVIFDLDNTLFDVEKYFYGAFQKISKYLSKKYNLSKRHIQKSLKALWKEKSSMYPNLFDDLLKIIGKDENIKDIVDMFNNYDGKIKLYKDVLPTLNKLKERNYKLGIITDGNSQRQKRKIKILGIQHIFDIIVYTNDLNNPKPSEISYREVIKRLKINPKKSFYVGDNPLIDFKGAKESGINTIRIVKGEFRHIPQNEFIDVQINKIKDLLKIINNYNN